MHDYSLEWFHSKPEHVNLELHDLSKQMETMYSVQEDIDVNLMRISEVRCLAIIYGKKT